MLSEDLSNITMGRDLNQPVAKEGPVARAVEKQTARIPSDLYLWLAVGAMGASAFMQFTGAKDKSLFIGQWVPTLLIFGVYNKIVKVAGSDRFTA